MAISALNTVFIANFPWRNIKFISNSIFKYVISINYDCKKTFEMWLSKFMSLFIREVERGRNVWIKIIQDDSNSITFIGNVDTMLGRWERFLNNNGELINM